MPPTMTLCQSSPRMRYESQMSRLTNTLNLSHIRPTQKSIELTGANDLTQTLHITVFDFTKQLYSLLADPMLNQMNNLTINPKQPFEQYDPPNGKLGEVHSGSWYQRHGSRWNKILKRIS